MTGIRKKVTFAFYLAVLATIAVVTSSYAWLSISKLPSVSDISLSILTDNAILVAMDESGEPGEWNTYLDLASLFEDMEPLTVATYSNNSGLLYEPEYDNDGRPSGVSVIEDQEGYYVSAEFWLQCTGNSTDVQLVAPSITESGEKAGGTYLVGAAIWNTSTISHDSGGNGAEYSARMAIICTKTDLDGNPIEDSVTYIYEPNADTHINEETEEGYVVTSSIDGSATLTDEDNLIIQESVIWSEQDPVLMDNVTYSGGEFIQNPILFTMDSSSLIKIEIRIWVEGQDIDCTNAAFGAESVLEASLQFGAVDSEENSTGITPR